MTIKDVAELSGVSVSTVSRVLNDHPDVSAAVRARVLQVAQQMHYVPNNSARDLVRPQTDSIGLVVRGIGNPFFSPVIQAVEQQVRLAGYNLVLHQIKTEDDELLAAAGLARSKKLRGLILLGGCFDYTADRAAALEVPFVCCSFTNYFGSLQPNSYSSVFIDDQKEACRAVEYLIAQGHRRIAILLDSTCDRSISELRYRGYCQALAKHGIPLEPALVQELGDFTMAAAYVGMTQLMDRQKDFTAVFAIADALAIAALKALHDGGRSVPDDCSLIGIDGIEMSNYTLPTLTTLVQPQQKLGSEAVRILLDVIHGQGDHTQLKLTAKLRAGGSVRAL